MQQKIITIHPGQILKVEWEKNWSNLTIYKDGVLIGSIPDKSDLKVGRRFALPDGGDLRVLVTKYGLEIWHNGKELMSNWKSGEVDGFGSAYKALFIIGGIQLAIAFVTFLLRTGAWALSGIEPAFVGLVLIGLGLWAKTSGNNTPFWIGIVFSCAILTINLLFFGLSGLLFELLLPGILVYYLYRGTKHEPFQLTRKKDLGANGALDSDL